MVFKIWWTKHSLVQITLLTSIKGVIMAKIILLLKVKYFCGGKKENKYKT
jgi:hypothetical protein